MNDIYDDGFIPDWQLGESEPHGVSVYGLVVYELDLSCRRFEQSCSLLHRRQRLYADKVQSLGRKHGHLTVFDQEVFQAASEHIEQAGGYDYLTDFIAGTERIAFESIGEVLQKLQRHPVVFAEQCAHRMVDVAPARSHGSQTATRSGRRSQKCGIM